MICATHIRSGFWLSLTLIGTAACGTSIAVGPPVAASDGEVAFVETVIDRTTGRQPGIRSIVTFAAADGSTIACGDWTAPDGISTSEWSPFYMRWRGATPIRVHLDDATGFGPALQGCNMARAGQVKITG